MISWIEGSFILREIDVEQLCMWSINGSLIFERFKIYKWYDYEHLVPTPIIEHFEYII